MVEFRDRDDVERWLNGRPHEDAVMLAARAALRVLPALAGELSQERAGRRRDAAAAIVLPVLRAMAAPWVAAKYPTRGVKLAAASASASASAASASAAFASSAAASASLAASAADAAFAADAASLASAAADAATDATPAASATDATADAAADAFAAVASDADALDRGVTARSLGDLPLWPTGTPDWAATRWARMTSDLLARHEDWDVWTDWYEARLGGRKVWRKSLEIARVTLDASFWEAGPKAVNGEIKRLIAAERTKTKWPPDDPPATLTERPSSHRFDWRGGRLEATPVVEQPFDPVLAEAIRTALIEKAADLLSALVRNNADPIVSRAVQRALDRLGGPIDRIAEGDLLMRAETVAAHARSYADPESPRERVIRALLDDFSTSLGHLVDCYPGVRQINASRVELEVQDADAPRIAAALNDLSEITRNSPAVAPSAVEALDVDRDAVADLGEKLATANTASRIDFIRTRAKLVASRLQNATNFVSTAVRRIEEELMELGATSWREVKTRTPEAVGDAAVALIHLPVLVLATQAGVPWEVIALLVPRLRPHAKTVKSMISAAQKRIEHPGE